MPEQDHISTNIHQRAGNAGNVSSRKGANLPAIPIQQLKEKESTEENLLPADQAAAQQATGDGIENNNPLTGSSASSFSPIQKKKKTSTKAVEPVQRFSPAEEVSREQTEMAPRFVPEENAIRSTQESSDPGNTPVQRKVFITGDGTRPPYDMPETEIAGLNQSAHLNMIMRNWVTGRRDHSFVDKTKMIIKASELMHGLTYDGTLASVASELTKGLAGAALLGDDVLLDILKRPFEANWFKAKACLAMGRWPSSIAAPPPHEGCLDMMGALVEMRSRKWDAFYKKHLPIARIQLNDPTLEIPPPDGSQSVTSDIDLSVKGVQSEAAVEYFNTNFKTEFGVAFEPGTVFDINLYSLDWMHGPDEELSEPDAAGHQTATIVPAAENNLQALDLNAMQDRSDTQEIWSYVKVMRNLSTAEIASYKTQVLAAFTPPMPPYIAMSKKLDDAEQNTINFKTRVEGQAHDMLAQFTADVTQRGLAAARSAFATGASAHESEAHYQEEALNMRASNNIYQTLIRQVKALRVRIAAVKGGTADAEGKSISDLAKLLANKIAEALTYANEVYASEGGVLHTVYGKQKGAKKKAEYARTPGKQHITDVRTQLSKQQYIQSVNENVGDSIHSLNHFGHIPKYAVFRSGKYLDRLCEATQLLDELLEVEGAESFDNYTELKEIGTVAAAEKNGALGRDPLAANTHTLFGTYDTAGVATLKQHILSFGAQATSFFNRST